MNAAWLYGLIEALDEIVQATQAIDDVPNIQEWMEGIRRDERERCAAEISSWAARQTELADRYEGCGREQHLFAKSLLIRLAADIRNREAAT